MKRFGFSGGPRIGSRIRVSSLSLALGATLWLGGPSLARAGAGDTALASVKQANEKLDKLLKQKKDDEGSKAEVKSVVAGLIDFEEMARRGLGAHWGEITPAQQKDFVATFRQNLERNYVKQLKTNLDYDVQYKGATGASDTESTVATVVKVRTKGKSTDTPIDYRMKKVGEKWLVWDVITDESSMVTNYKASWNKVIGAEGFDGLLKKLKKKLAEEGGPATGATTTSPAPAATPTEIPKPAAKGKAGVHGKPGARK